VKSARLAACALRVRPDDPLIRLMPDGVFHAPRGALSGTGPWRLTPLSAQKIIAANKARTTDILIDFEHQALLSERNGQPVPAAGWIDPRSLEYRPTGDEPGLYGAVSWTPPAKALIKDYQYRYLSPVFPYDETGAPLDILHVALTNVPAIDAPVMAALSAALSALYPAFFTPPSTTETTPMTFFERLRTALELPDTATEEAALAHLAALKAKADAPPPVAALSATSEPDPARFVPIEVMKDLQSQVAALSVRLNDDEASRLIEAAMAQGKLIEAQRAWATGLGRANLAALKAFIDTAPGIAALQGVQSQGQGQGPSATRPCPAGEHVQKLLGLSAEEFAKATLKGD
jgi:phage I-like protein